MDDDTREFKNVVCHTSLMVDKDTDNVSNLQQPALDSFSEGTSSFSTDLFTLDDKNVISGTVCTERTNRDVPQSSNSDFINCESDHSVLEEDRVNISGQNKFSSTDDVPQHSEKEIQLDTWQVSDPDLRSQSVNTVVVGVDVENDLNPTVLPVSGQDTNTASDNGIPEMMFVEATLDNTLLHPCTHWQPDNDNLMQTACHTKHVKSVEDPQIFIPDILSVITHEKDNVKSDEAISKSELDMLTSQNEYSASIENDTNVTAAFPYDDSLIEQKDCRSENILKGDEYNKLLHSDSEMMPVLAAESHLKSEDTEMLLSTSQLIGDSSTETSQFLALDNLHYDPLYSNESTDINKKLLETFKERQISGSSTNDTPKQPRITAPSVSLANCETTASASVPSLSSGAPLKGQHLLNMDMSAMQEADQWQDSSALSQDFVDELVVCERTSNALTTLQEQQAKWMKMFQLLEKQHKTDMYSQFEQHQRHIERVQQQIEEDIIRQQEHFSKKLAVHRDFLETALSGSDLNVNNQSILGANLSAIRFSPEIHPMYKSLTLPAREHKVPMNVRRSLTFEDLTPPVSPKIGNTKKTLEDTYKDAGYDLQIHDPLLTRQFTDLSKYIPRVFSNEDVHSTPPKQKDIADGEQKIGRDSSNVSQPNREMSLKEKHAKHLSDLHDYYELELQDLRDAMTSSASITESPYRKVMEENIRLQSKLNEVEEDLSRAQRKNKNLDTRIQSLQVRTEEQMIRYESSQKQVASLQHTVDEMAIHTKQMEAIIMDHCEKNEQLSSMLKQAYKVQDDQLQERKQDGDSHKKVMLKYDLLVRENDSNKSILNSMEGKLYDTRNEVIELKRIISKLELENKRLTREQDSYQSQKRVSNISDAILSTLPYESPITTSPRPSSFSASKLSTSLSSHKIVSPARTTNNYSEYVQQSPLLRAECELQRLRQLVRDNLGAVTSYTSTVPCTPSKSQPQTPDSLLSDNRNSPPVIASTHYRTSPDDVTILDSQSYKQTEKIYNKVSTPKVKSPVSFDIDIGQTLTGRKSGGKIPKKKSTPIDAKHAVDQVKSGDIIARPAWETVQTSTVKPRKSAISNKCRSSPVKQMTREEQFQSHVKIVQDLQSTYDRLQAQKVQLESALSKLPTRDSTRYRSRHEQELLETRLDEIDREMGTVRMSLKRYNVIKSCS